MIRLNLGCGKNYLEGYVNVDLYTDKVDVKDDITILDKVRWRIGTKKVNEIYSAHSLMCVPETQLLDTLKLWWDFLRDEGVLIIETVDLDKQIKEYNKDIRNSEIVVRSLFGDNKQDGKGLRYQFNFYLLKLWLERAGFRNVEEIKQSEHSVHDSKYNLTVRAIK